jgi:hypothetical protein
MAVNGWREWPYTVLPFVWRNRMKTRRDSVKIAAFGPELEPWAYRIRRNSVNHSTFTFERMIKSFVYTPSIRVHTVTANHWGNSHLFLV